MNKYLKSKIESLNSDQLKLFNDIQNNKLLQICIPTGAGKGYLMMVDLLNRFVKSEESIFAISSHRLMLNTQHLNDLFNIFSPVIGKIGFIFVGSSKYDTSKFQQNVDFNKALLKSKLSYNEIVTSTTNSKDVDSLVKNHLQSGRKVVILTTYHSIHTLKNQPIDTIFCDEAHTLASDEDGAQFKENFQSITSTNKYFLTATPKDCFEDTESFLMNNEEVFGKRVGLTFKECIDKGYMVKPILHIAMPDNFDNTLEFKSVKNMTKFVKDTFEAHKKWLKEVSFDGGRIAPKILVKCPSVDDMWKIWTELNGNLEGVRICAGASRNDMSNFNHFIDSEGIVGRSEYLERIQMFDEGEMAIVLHYDTMSEGINVSGFSGVMFLGGKLPTIIKTLQNTGRATRLHPFDRSRLSSGEILVGDGKWIKPNCAVIIPFWDSESEFTKAELAKQIKGLRDNFGYDPTYYVSIGSDIGTGKKSEDMDALNKKNEKNKKSELIEEIRHEIEVLDKEEMDLKESERINNMSVEEWFNYANNIN
jgi:hypothetical protein